MIGQLAVVVEPAPSATEYEGKVRAIFGDLGDDFLKLYPSSNLEESVLEATRDGLYSWTAQRLALKRSASFLLRHFDC